MLTKAEEKYLKTCEQQLRLPKWKFIVFYGLTWALFTMIFTTVIGAIFNFGDAMWINGKSILVSLLVWTVAGFIYGLWSRSIIAKR